MLTTRSELCHRLVRRQNVCCRTVAYNAHKKDRQLAVGDRLHGYTIEHVVPVPELSLTATFLSHRTGAQHLHLARQDSDNVFGVSLRTTPRDSTGIPHILEHLSLCGSAKYPVRDPFFKMLTRSLSTFMNAFTASDWTFYPFSTQNPQDYQNLMSVYLDAVFYPLLRPLDFSQEGWRLEHENPLDPQTPIVLKGVVYNEMKGAFSNSQQLFYERMQNLLLPSHTYGVVSGGDPAFIPDLTWEKLKQFHSQHYHPSNARFYTYGNFPLEGHLRQINEQVLDKFQSAQVDTAVPPESRWQQQKEAVITCAPDPMSPDQNKQTTVAVCYLLNDITNINESCALSILGSLLVDGEKSPFYQSLIESNLGSDYAPAVGFKGYTKESSFAIGLQRVSADDVEAVKQIIDKTIDEVIRDGFKQERIETVLHKIELGQKHQTDKFGLNLGMGVLPCWIHDGNPIDVLQLNKQVDWFKQQLKATPTYLQDLLVKYFKNNHHRLTLVMKPDDNYNKNCQEVERAKLEQKVYELTHEQKNSVYRTGVELQEKQSLQEDISCLPSLKVSDISSEIERVQLASNIEGHVPVYHSAQPTNGVAYFRAVSSMASLPVHLKPLIPLFCNVVTKMGVSSMDYKELSEQIEFRTGGLDVSPLITTHPSDPKLFEQSVLFSSYCLNRNVTDMFRLWTEIFTALSLTDVTRLQTLVHMVASEAASGLSDDGHSYAMVHAGSMLSPSASIKELMSGMTQVHLMKSLAEMDNFDVVIGQLKEIANHLLCSDSLRCFVTSTPEHLSELNKTASAFIRNLPSRDQTGKGSLESYGEDKSFVSHPSWTHFELPFQVNYIARSLPSAPYSHQDFASLRILARILSTRFLHREVREKGGAYGGGAKCDSDGVFNFYSYRDPNLQRTIDAFSSAAQWAADGSFIQQDIDEAKLSVFSQVDSPLPPSRKGLRQFLSGIDDNTFQEHRQRLLGVNRNNLVDVAHRYLLTDKDTSPITVLGPANQITSESSQWTVKKQDE